ncbi:AfsR/SARP family transcriptional regulator [Mangrovihabitans endophyticus]|uniref:OmpR/PhoB-type domain-containing protein n=1 Tax=Mangrovihabitans endophyticus TaxID=1751298 RepID=A0A8J3BY02_9ACTN|nr:AfsR/SARP family transcriptional regulator [Mangrovihabitans endophyticus]GGK81741.1 hypothetical protein GCM10012284_14730 [Mangrovihabitans endophyticus]
MTISFRVLGPLEIRQGASTVPLPAVKPRVLMAYLLAHANRTVPIDDLVGEIWASSPPPSATANVRTYVAGLRRSIRRDSPSLQILAKPGAYRLTVTGGEYLLDIDKFRNLVRLGRTEMAAGSPHGALEFLDRALELWRGPAFEGVSDGPVLGAYASHLEEERAQAMEEAFEARLALGRYAEVVPALRRHIRAEPLRERPYALLMTALYRCGDAAGALDVFGSARQALTSHLGIEPGPQLAELHRAVLERNPALEPVFVPESGAVGTPFLTPPAIPEFRGRSAEIALGFGVLTATSRSTPAILAVSGMAGVGKTALAVTLAHRVRAHYSDGQLYADLHGDDREPTAPAQVIRHFLDLLEVPSERVPEGLAERAGLLRSRLAGRRVLVLLDNVADESQMRALLPGSADCAVLVTSRRRLSALDGADFLDLTCPAEPQAMAMFAGFLGREPATVERAAAREIVRMCGSLPLALRIAAARPRRPLPQTASLLRDEAQRLGRLRVGDLAVRPRFASGYAALQPADRRVLRLVSLLSTPDVTVPVAAAMTGDGTGPVTTSLENLADVHLLIETVPEDGGPARYRFHELVRIFARERAESEDPHAARVMAAGGGGRKPATATVKGQRSQSS